MILNEYIDWQQIADDAELFDSHEDDYQIDENDCFIDYENKEIIIIIVATQTNGKHPHDPEIEAEQVVFTLDEKLQILNEEHEIL